MRFARDNLRLPCPFMGVLKENEHVGRWSFRLLAVCSSANCPTEELTCPLLQNGLINPAKGVFLFSLTDNACGLHSQPIALGRYGGDNVTQLITEMAITPAEHRRIHNGS